MRCRRRWGELDQRRFGIRQHRNTTTALIAEESSHQDEGDQKCQQDQGDYAGAQRRQQIATLVGR